MEFTSEKFARLIVLAALAAGLAWSKEIQFNVRHDHLRKGCAGTLTVDETGVRFAGPKGHAWSWKYQDIQQLKLAPGSIHLLTYEDNRVLAGTDRAFEFTGKVPDELYAFWKDRLDSRFVAEVADPAVEPVWQIPAKHLGRLKGSQGMLEIAGDRIVYKTGSKDDSRTWRLADIQNISTSGPYDLTITTPEKEFRFQLKQVLSETRYNDLWRKLNDTKGRTE